MTESGGVQESRTRIQQVIETATEPMTVEMIVEATGLHANTVRGHLDVLLAGDVISREPAESPGRGRPRWLYRAASPKASPVPVPRAGPHRAAGTSRQCGVRR